MKKILSMIMAIALLVTLIPFSPDRVAADPATDYFQIANYSTSSAAPSEVNTDSIDLTGTFIGVAPSSISYEAVTVVLEGSNIVEVSNKRGTDVKPEIINNNAFRFASVKLEPGLNQITLKGTNSVGNIVSGVVYVRYTNAPMLYDIKAPDGRLLRDTTDPTVIDTKSIILKAENAKEIYVNGKKMYSGDGKSFVASDLPLEFGRNTLVIRANNGTKEIIETRDVIYYAGVPTAFDTKIGATSVNRGSVVNNPTGVVTGSIAFRQDSTVTDQVDKLKVSLTDPKNPLVELNATVKSVKKDGRFIVFNYTTDTGNLTLIEPGLHQLQVKGDYGKQTSAFVIDFNNRTTNDVFITDVKQIFNVIDDKTNVTYDKSAPLTDNTMFMSLPVYILVKTSGATSSLNMESVINGLPSGVFIKDTRKLLNGAANEYVFKIEGMAPGQQRLEITPDKAADKKVFTVTYVSAPYLEIINIPNGKTIYKADQFDKIVVKHTNFSSTDLDKIKLTINGVQKDFGTSKDTDNNLVYTTTPADQGVIVPGQNKITVSGVANGVPVSTTISLFLFAKYSPEITSMIPIPYVVDPSGAPIPQTGDPNGLFKLVSDRKYSTSEKAYEMLFTVRSADSFEVKVDGKFYASAKLEAAGWNIDPKVFQLVSFEPVLGDDVNKTPVTDENGKTVYLYHFRLIKKPNDTTDSLSLPKTGEKSIMITARKGSANVSQTITIVRESGAYIIRSPKLPEESVINQNFLKVSIEADGATQVLLGKEVMKKDSVYDIFRAEVKNLKVGKNTIKFTVVQGNQKTNGQFTVNYAGEKLVGGLFKTNIPTSGKLSLFKGDVALELPKGTLLRESNTTPGQAPPEINMFDSQQILFGIADRKDGRIVKKYNAVGEELSGRPLDGTMKDIPADLSATQYLTLPSRYSYASDLYWMDAGYLKKDSQGNVTEVVEGSLPYKAINDPMREPNFYERANSQWMEPTQRGTIKLKYDPKIVDAISSNLAIWRWVDRDQKWVNLGGTINASSKTISAPFDGFGYYAVFGIRYTFDDVIGHPYARNSVELMLANGIMKPVSSDEFGVYNNVSRGEFATMLVKMLDIPLEYDVNNPTFEDVRDFGNVDSLWDFRYVETAVRKGIIRGVAPRIFDPNGDLTREHAATMIARALNLKLATPEKELPKLQKQFTDAGTIDYYMITAVSAITKAGYIEGVPTQIEGQKKPTYKFVPKSNLKRADAAVIAERIMKKLKKIK
ncbi:S-layer homology domain-containing protein [Paenibacillus terrigena]|uniref:S-layer homology domain-containing protein n=1 Tax=Paenibacillus terrigena TaxID=369333 RepID=UPI0028D5A4EA|nr:S-layer homology domain-containing protein [Paenibacillus terrigena]